MSDVRINLDPLFYGSAIGLLVALLGTPALWRLLRGVPPAGRALAVPPLAVNLACIGLAGLLALPFVFYASSLTETVLFAALASGALQGALFLILLLFSPKRP
ncbi:hypothetical protein [Roseococcus pinisoli]|uniref:Uncharacterized protein n=1 Tax=Roseococcus pinisoli TaxID=2835040 RepID=A0ABS5QDC6_9PROT|nr:hypothetical protein [Roseococcus pinisoli]MBS7810965.1 hypothetical protein [Roseococcus pinisoli]